MFSSLYIEGILTHHAGQQNMHHNLDIIIYATGYSLDGNWSQLGGKDDTGISVHENRILETEIFKKISSSIILWLILRINAEFFHILWSTYQSWPLFYNLYD